MESYIARSPMRVDLSGGTLDFWPIYVFLEPCITVNLAIDIWTEVALYPRMDQRVEIEVLGPQDHQDRSKPETALESLETKGKFQYAHMEEFLKGSHPSLKLMQVVCEALEIRQGFSVTIASESPVGAGLGASSSLLISILKAFNQWLDIHWSTERFIEIARNLETKVLGQPAGTQDYYPPLLGGLNIINYSSTLTHVENIAFDDSVFKSQMLVVYTGKPHHSGLNNWQVIRNAIEKNSDTLLHLAKIRGISKAIALAMKTRSFQNFTQLLNDEYEARVALSDTFSSPQTETLRQIALKAGAEAIKICGAGGGGSVLVWTPVSQKNRVAKACQKQGYQVLNSRPVEPAIVGPKPSHSRA